MSWSGRDALLAEFAPRFHDHQLAVDSLTEYIKGSRVLDDRRARQWLEQDLIRDQELAAIEQTSAELAVPRPSLYALGSCYHCAGRGVVRIDVDPGHADFGKAKPCPVCSVSTRNPAVHCERCAALLVPPPPRNRCWKCGRFEDESHGEKCRNPKWHASTPAVQPTGDRRDYAARLGAQWRVA